MSARRKAHTTEQVPAPVAHGHLLNDDVLGPWKVCNQAAEKLTQETCLGWREEVEKLLIFAGLFSAIATAFTLEANKVVEGDPTDMSMVLLKTIILQLHNISNPQANLSINLDPEAPITPYAQHISLFYSASLMLSLLSVLGGIVCLQWLREFGTDMTGISDQDHLDLQFQRHESLKRWGVFPILNTLPLLLLLALVLFFAGFLEALWVSKSLAAIPITALVSIALLFIIITSFLPALQLAWLTKRDPSTNSPGETPSATLCPYRSPQAWLVHSTFFAVAFTVRYFNVLSYFKPLAPFEDIGAWTDYDTWWNKKRKASEVTFPGLFWVAREHIQSRKLVLASYGCLYLTVCRRWKEYISQVEQSDVPSLRWLCLCGVNSLNTFEAEFNISRNIADDFRLSSFSAIYWDIVNGSGGSTRTFNKYLENCFPDVVLDAFTRLLPNREFDEKDPLAVACVGGSQTYTKFLNIVAHMAKQHIPIKKEILDVVTAIIVWFSHNSRAPDQTFVSALTVVLQNFIDYESWEPENEKYIDYYYRRIIYNNRNSSFLIPFLRHVSTITSYAQEHCQWDNTFLEIFLDIYINWDKKQKQAILHTIPYPYSCFPSLPQSHITAMDLLPLRPLLLSRATFIQYLDIVQTARISELGPRKILDLVSNMLCSICRDIRPLEQAFFDALDKTLLHLLKAAVVHMVTDDEIRRITGILHNFRRDLSSQMPSFTQPKIWLMVKEFGRYLDYIIPLDHPLGTQDSTDILIPPISFSPLPLMDSVAGFSKDEPSVNMDGESDSENLEPQRSHSRGSNPKPDPESIITKNGRKVTLMYGYFLPVTLQGPWDFYVPRALSDSHPEMDFLFTPRTIPVNVSDSAPGSPQPVNTVPRPESTLPDFIPPPPLPLLTLGSDTYSEDDPHPVKPGNLSSKIYPNDKPEISQPDPTTHLAGPLQSQDARRENPDNTPSEAASGVINPQNNTALEQSGSGTYQ